MKKLQTVSHYSDKELKNILDSQTEIRAFRDRQIIYSVQTNPGKKAEEIAGILGIKISKVLRVIQQYNKSGINWRVYGQCGGRREQRCHLSIKEEAALLSSIEEEALSGRILTYKQMKKKVETEVGKEVSDDYIWDLFSSHNWKKKVPRPSHPKADRQAQEAYKKTSG
ncbi:MAG: winged helix-turn-helix domain-containing protein, partial [Tannerella sp.]|nr:winged helix-turn-helix domain-containing protein [Tannerella sp.]